MARIIGEVRPRYVFVENSPAIIRRGLARVLGDLATVGPYDCRWGRIGADDCGAPHIRKRFWLVGVLADAHDAGLERHTGNETGKHKPGRIETRQDGLATEGGLGAGAENVADTNLYDGRKEYSTESQDRKAWMESGCGGAGCRKQGISKNVANAESVTSRKPSKENNSIPNERTTRQEFDCGGVCNKWLSWPREPDLPRMAYGVADRVDREKATGNGQVPRLVAAAWNLLRD
jgi:DNA (cytosine-5)-methyltransferase 1